MTSTGNHSATSLLRRGVTLVELLVVIMIMLMITAIAIPVIAPSMKNRDVREAARMVDVFINGARTRALQAGHPFGVMIERMPGQPNGAVTLSYCEQPDPYSGDFAGTISYPGMPPGSNGSSIRMLGNGGFGTWVGPLTPFAGGYATQPTSTPSNDPLFPLGDLGWIQSTLPGGAGLLTSIAPGDIITVNGTAFRIWAGEPFIDVNQNGVWDTGEPFADVDGSGVTSPGTVGSYTPPNPAFIDPTTGYFIQPNVSSNSPFPQITWGSQSAFITYMYADPVVAAQYMNSTGFDLTTGGPMFFGPGGTWSSASLTPFPYSITQYTINPSPPPPLLPVPNAAKSWKFSLARRPVRTSAPSLQLPGEAVIDLGANYPDQQFSIIVPVPGSGMEVLVQQQNASGWWSTFRANPALDPTVPGSLASQPTGSATYQPPDPTSIMITFQPNGIVDKVYSWSEANNTNTTMSIINWTDWQGRIPASPIYLLVGRQDLINGDPTLIGRIGTNTPPYDPVTKTGGPIYNVQDPNALWVVINPQTGAVATAENVGFDLTQPIPQIATAPQYQMQVYWAANVYYSRRLGRAMLDMGGR